MCSIHADFLLAVSLLMLCWSALLQITLFVVLFCHFAVLVCPPPDYFVCGFILPFCFQDESQTFVNKCL